MNIECFSCAGGFAEGFRRAGIDFDFAFDFAKDHCDSYEANLGYRPICMDVRDLLRMAAKGLVSGPVDLFVADPPCTPWSRAGLRQGTEDERDMIEDTCELIRILRPKAYLIGNVPGLDDSNNWHIVQRVIGGLQKYGYCVADFATLDAADYGVPQRRIRPFWFGHLEGPCIRWPIPSHIDAKLLAARVATMTLPGFSAEHRQPWITCRQALGHLSPDELGRPVRLRKRNQNSSQHGSVMDKPARVVGTSNLSDGNVILNDKHPPSDPDQPSQTIAARQRGNGSNSMRKLSRHDVPDRTNTPDAPARAITSQSQWGNGAIKVSSKHPPNTMDAPSTTVRGGGDLGHSAPPLVLTYDVHHPPCDIDKPSNTIRAGSGGGANRSMRVRDEDLPLISYTSKHPPSEPDAPATTVKASDGGGSKRVLKTRGTPRARDAKRPKQGLRVGTPDKPSATMTSKASRIGAGEAHVMQWPWDDRPATTIQCDQRLAPPGHHDENWDGGLLSGEEAVVLSEKAAIILQGFPQDWKILGETQKARWSQIGQAMPPPLAHAVATSVAEQMRAAAEITAPNDPNQSLATGKLTVV